MRYYISFFIFFIFWQLSRAQSPYTLPGSLTDKIADRWDILYDYNHTVFSSQRNTAGKEIVNRAFQNRMRDNISKMDKWDIDYILAGNNEYLYLETDNTKPANSFVTQKLYDTTGIFYSIESIEEPNDIKDSKGVSDRKDIDVEKGGRLFKHLYKTKANFYEVSVPGFEMRVNPILNLKYGNASKDQNTIFQNTRGGEIRGTIDDKVYYYTSIYENQARFNNYIEARIEKFKAIPGQGGYKSFNSSVIERLTGYDYLNAQAYVGINATKSVAIELGHGKHFIGNGIRSLLLANYANNYFYLKFNTRIWKFHYQNLFTELAPISSIQNPSDKLLPKKYMVNHYLSFKPTKQIEIGLFEAVVFSRENQFELQYLNPIILYRTVEHLLDSPDNALVGLNFKWNIKHRFQLYGQFVLDEFNLTEIKDGNGWWANKNGLQIGAKYINVAGIDHLDAQIEYNRVRPYTYSHRDSLSVLPRHSNASYSHFNQPLAHPLGANLKEIVFNLNYRPTKAMSINARVIKSTYGQDLENENFGGDILVRSGLRANDYGNEIGQGVNTNLLSIGIDISYHFAHNYFLDFNVLHRTVDAAVDGLDIDTRYIGGGLRVNISNAQLDY
ncbi:MAG: hypothetical protein V3V14_11815 [Saprospiraceae bacterium]